MRQWWVLFVASAVAGSVLVGDVTQAAPAESVSVGSGGVTLFGKGFGHGKGMSQFGAYGAALARQNATQILNFYYPGTVVSTVPNPQIRVRLTALDGGIMMLTPASTRPEAGILATGADGRAVRLPLGVRGRAVPKPGAFDVQKPVGRVWGTVATLKAPVTFSGPRALNAAFGRRKGDCKNSFDVVFAGTARAVYYNGRAYYQAVTAMETYLRGVLSSEMPATWPAEALRAQAVAARTYTAWARNRGYFYDVRDDTGDQCWDGAYAEHPRTTHAVTTTPNVVRVYGGRPILAQFSSSNGGWTAPGNVRYLPGRADPNEARAKCPYLSWKVTLTPQRLAAIDGPGGVTRPTRVYILRRDGAGVWGGRVLQMRVSGYDSAGRSTYATVAGDAFRRAYGMRTNYFGFRAG